MKQCAFDNGYERRTTRRIQFLRSCEVYAGAYGRVVEGGVQRGNYMK